MGDIPVEVALSIRAEPAEGRLRDAAAAWLWRVNIIGVIFRCRPGVTGPPHRGTRASRPRQCPGRSAAPAIYDQRKAAPPCSGEWSCSGPPAT